MASWSCSMCTFINPPTQKSACQICLSPQITCSSPSLPSSSSWSCKACTFPNPILGFSCEMCGGQKRTITAMDELGDDEVGDISVAGSLTSGKSRRRRDSGGEDARSSEVVRLDDDNDDDPGVLDKGTQQASFKILSYNVWFREDMEVHKRMQSLGNLILQNSPDFIFFQEVTPNIYNIFQKENWWNDYISSVSLVEASERTYFCMQMSKLPVVAFSRKPFQKSIMGRELCMAEVDFGMDKKLLLATSHLESPCPGPPRWDQMFVEERVSQAKESIKLLKDSPNAVFGGDMNWDDKLDGPFPLQQGWIDPWMELHPTENGWTYDTKANEMLSANRKLQKRLDRFACKLQDFKLTSIEMIGQEAIPEWQEAIPGFAVQYISIMLPSQTRHLMCQSQTGCSSGSKAFSTYVVAGYHRGGEDYLFFIPCLAQSSKVATRPY